MGGMVSRCFKGGLLKEGKAASLIFFLVMSPVRTASVKLAAPVKYVTVVFLGYMANTGNFCEEVMD